MILSMYFFCFLMHKLNFQEYNIMYFLLAKIINMLNVQNAENKRLMSILER